MNTKTKKPDMLVTTHSVPTRYSEWIWRGLVLLVLTGQLYVSNNYVNKTDFKELTSRVENVHYKATAIEGILRDTQRFDAQLEVLKAAMSDIKERTTVTEMRLRTEPPKK